MLQYPPADWVIPRQTNDGQPVLDVAVIGGGMCGLVATFALLRAGISNIRTFDSNEEGREGPWPKYARMETLRSPKTLGLNWAASRHKHGWTISYGIEKY